MQKIIKFLNKNKYIILLIIIYILFFIQMQNVFYYADDYFVLLNDKFDVREYAWMMDWFYTSWSGRLLGHFIVLIVLNLGGIFTFRILNTIFLFFVCYYLAKIINIEKSFDQFKVTFIITLILLGLYVRVSNEILYWAYGSILYLWGSLPLLVLIYFVFDCIINHKKMTIIRLIVSCILLLITSSIMESTLIFGIALLFLIFLVYKKEALNKRKLGIIFIFSIVVLICLFFIPGNINRLNTQFIKNDSLYSFFSKLKIYIEFIYFNVSIMHLIVILSIVSCINVLKKSKSKFNIICACFLTILNILYVILYITPFYYYFYGKYNFIFIIIVIYILLNIYILLVSNNTNNKKYYVFLIISGIFSSLVSNFLVSYNTNRFYYLLFAAIIVVLMYVYFSENNEQKLLILFLYTMFINFYLSFILLIIFDYCKLDSSKIKKCFILIFLCYNLCYFGNVMYHYYLNSKSVTYNYNKLYKIRDYEMAKEKGQDVSNIDLTNIVINENNIELKKIKYEEYSYHTADNYDYMLGWFVNYFKIKDYKIVWVDS